MALPWFSRILEFIGENASIITKKQTFIKNFYPVIYGYKIKTPQLPRLPQMTQNGNAKKIYETRFISQNETDIFRSRS